jgi:hypothetical protein
MTSVALGAMAAYTLATTALVVLVVGLVLRLRGRR